MDLKLVAALTLSVAVTSFAVGWLGARLSHSEGGVRSAGLIPERNESFSVVLDPRGATGNW